MSEKELLKALEDDARSECTAILENAKRDADAITKETIDELEKVKQRRLEQAKTSMQAERVRRLANAKLYAREVIIRERQFAAAKILDEVNNRLKELRKDKDYPEILKRLCKEAMDGWHAMGTDFKSVPTEKALIMVSKQDISYLKHILGYEIVSDESEDISPGVVIMSRDKRFKIINTLHSRLEKKRTELVSMIDKMLFGEIPKS